MIDSSRIYSARVSFCNETDRLSTLEFYQGYNDPVGSIS